MTMMKQPKTKGIVLAGSYYWGETRLERALKGPLVPVAQTPVICYPLRWLRDHGIEGATICANSSSRTVRDYLADGGSLSMRLDYYEDHTPRGPAGCIRDAGFMSDADTFVVAEGAVIPSVDLRDVLAAHKAREAAVTVVVDHDRRRRGIMGDHPPVPSGVYVFDRRVLNAIPASGFQDIKEGLLPRLYRAGEQVLTHVVPGVSVRVLNCETYLAANEWMVERIAEKPGDLDGYIYSGEIITHPTARIDLEARFLGPVLVGPGARIMKGATIVGPTTIGADCTVEEGALVTRSVLWKRCVVGAGAMVDRCLLVDGAMVKPHGQLFSMRVPGALPEPVDARSGGDMPESLGILPDAAFPQRVGQA
jgi:NDP-sugar pyrophosphorylase family protein